MIRQAGNIFVWFVGNGLPKAGFIRWHEILWEAEKAIQKHITKEHASTFDFLLELDKKYTGLTEHQKTLLTCFYQGSKR